MIPCKSRCNNKLQPKLWLDFNVLKHFCKFEWLGVNSCWSMSKVSGLYHVLSSRYSYLFFMQISYLQVPDWKHRSEIYLVFVQLVTVLKNKNYKPQILPIYYACEILKHFCFKFNLPFIVFLLIKRYKSNILSVIKCFFFKNKWMSMNMQLVSNVNFLFKLL